jgi:hypothetical protein
MIFSLQMILLANGKTIILKNVLHALTHKKTETTYFDALTQIDANGAVSSSSPSGKHATNYKLDLIFETFYSLPLKHGYTTPQQTLLHTLPCTPLSSTNKHRSDGDNFLMAVSAQSGRIFRMTTCMNENSTQ